MDLNKVGKLIANERKRKNLTQNKLGELLNVNEKTVSKWERGVNAPDISSLLDLSKILELDIQELLTGEKKEQVEQGKSLVENNKKAIDGLKYYNKKSKIKYIYLSIAIMISIIFIFISLFFVNNYNQFHVYSVKSELDNYTISGYVIFNKNNNFVAVDNITFFDEYVGTADELFIKDLKISIYSNQKMLYSTGFSTDDYGIDLSNEYHSYNEILNKIKIFIFEEKQEELNIFENIDLDKLSLQISYQKMDDSFETVNIPLKVEKKYSNNTFI